MVLTVPTDEGSFVGQLEKLEALLNFSPHSMKSFTCFIYFDSIFKMLYILFNYFCAVGFPISLYL